MGTRVWIDLENSPHVPFFLPWIDWLHEQGHEVYLTARDLSQTHELLRLHGLPFDAVGGHAGGGRLQKAARVLARAADLARRVRSRRIGLALGHGSRAQVIAAAGLRIPSITFLDYEYVSLKVFGLFCRRVCFPDAVPSDVLRARGVAPERLISYPGYKEQLYLNPETDRPRPEMPPLILVRPPARRAHYHTPLSERLYDRLLERLAREAAGARVLFLPRYEDDRIALGELADRHDHFEVAREVALGRELILRASLVVSGGGTMIREAAVLDVPAASFFGGPVGGVDRALTKAGRLRMLRCEEDVDRLPLPTSAGRMPVGGGAPLPDTGQVRECLRREVAAFLY